ncbi:hypothetical protein B1A91_07250 [Neisseria meningitidis]|nr:hypothetical protein B1A91_07250 [Neisseria meningitidis]
MPRLAVLSVLSAASSPCPDLNLIHYSLSGFSDFRHISARFNFVISPVSVIADNTVVFHF